MNATMPKNTPESVSMINSCNESIMSGATTTQGPSGMYYLADAIDMMKAVNKQLTTENLSTVLRSVETLECILEKTVYNNTRTSIIAGSLVAHLFRAVSNFSGAIISASNEMVESDGVPINNSIVTVNLPKELLKPITNTTIVFCMITSPKLYEKLWVLDGRLVGLSVSNQKVSGLQDRVNISMLLQHHTVENKGDRQPSCQFFNFSSSTFHRDGCTTEWKKEEGIVVCSCDHLTYFAVLMMSPSISKKDQEILGYITVIGCSLSLFFLLVTVILYTSERCAGTDVSHKVHINLAVALILLNVHFLPSQQVATLSSTGPCIYIAVLLHYSLMATFTWTAIEGFHLYLLLVRVFNIYVRRYLLKLSLVGWGFPAVIVILIVIIDKNQYSRVTLHTSETNGTAVEMCYVSSDVVKLVTTVVLFGIIFLFNLCILAVTLSRLVFQRTPEEKGTTVNSICTILGITCLLGIPWGIIFFSFGQLTVPGLYLFCVLNSLQGFFLFLWFSMFRCKAKVSQPGSFTQSSQQ
uniref:Adhesion G-protein coupled receptor G5-like n=1 Tax=Esox lucius TaxID=8010 RepID=A0AAY5JWY4_ESOLU